MGRQFEFTYVFHFQNGERLAYRIVLDEHLQLVNPPRAGASPEWTKLDVHKCPDCPLNSKLESYCPAALAVSELLQRFSDLESIERIRVEVQTAERTYAKTTDLQTGLSSILGIIMPASGCPALSFLRPMARFHLPFSTIDETVVRSVSLFLLRQYFAAGSKPDFDQCLDELNAHYEALQTVDDQMIKRVRMMARTGDVNRNAIVVLKVLSDVLTMEIRSHLKSLEPLFAD
jgi:hypothetical protein